MLEQPEQAKQTPAYAITARLRNSHGRSVDDMTRHQEDASRVVMSLASWRSTDEYKAPLGTPHKQDKRRGYVLPMWLLP